MSNFQCTGVCVVFEDVSDFHIDKGVIEIPNVIAEYYKVPLTVITKENDNQLILESRFNLVCFGNSLKGQPQVSKFDKDWFLDACKLAAKYANFLFIYSFPSNFGAGAKAFKTQFKKLSDARVLVKYDKNTKVVRALNLSLFDKLRNNYFYSREYKYVDLNTLENKSTLGFFKTKFSFFKDKFYYLPNCYPSRLDGEQLNVTQRKKQIIHVARLGVRQKATEILLLGWLVIAKNYPDWKLVLVGGGEQQFFDFWNQIIKDYGLSNQVEFAGQVTDKNKVFNYYKESEIFIHTSRHESGPIALFEAIKLGCAVIATEVGAIEYFFESNKDGLIKTDDYFDLSRRIDLFINNKAIREEQRLDLGGKINTLTWNKLVHNMLKSNSM